MREPIIIKYRQKGANQVREIHGCMSPKDGEVNVTTGGEVMFMGTEIVDLQVIIGEDACSDELTKELI